MRGMGRKRRMKKETREEEEEEEVKEVVEKVNWIWPTGWLLQKRTSKKVEGRYWIFLQNRLKFFNFFYFYSATSFSYSILICHKKKAAFFAVLIESICYGYIYLKKKNKKCCGYQCCGRSFRCSLTFIQLFLYLHWWENFFFNFRCIFFPILFFLKLLFLWYRRSNNNSNNEKKEKKKKVVKMWK